MQKNTTNNSNFTNKNNTKPDDDKLQTYVQTTMLVKIFIYNIIHC